MRDVGIFCAGDLGHDWLTDVANYSLSGAKDMLLNPRCEGVVNFSKQQNVLHILIDAYQADAFEELIKRAGTGGKLQPEF